MKTRSNTVSMRVRVSLLVWTGVTIWGLNSSPLYAEGGFKTPTETAAALGNVGGRTAYINDLTAILYNPANLVDQQDPAVLAGIGTLYINRKYTAQSGEVDHQPRHWVVLPHLFGATPLGSRSNLVFGVGLNVEQGLATSWSKEGYFQYIAPYSASIKSFQLSPTLSARLTDTLSIGAGAHLLQSELALRQYLLGVGRMRFDADGHGWGGTLAATWDMTSRQRIALIGKTPIKVDYEGDFNLDTAGGSSRSDFSSGIQYPGSLGLGYGLRITESLQLGADVKWAQCSSIAALPIRVKGYPFPDVKQNWQDTWDFGLGLGWKITPVWTLRTGYAFYERPTSDYTFYPMLTECNRHTFSLGAGYAWDAHQIDVGLAYAYYKPIEIIGNQTPAFNGKYEASMIQSALSYTFRF